MLYGAVEHWVSGALVNVGDMIWYMMNSVRALNGKVTDSAISVIHPFYSLWVLFSLGIGKCVSLMWWCRQLVKLAKRLRKEKVNMDVINFGEQVRMPPFLHFSVSDSLICLRGVWTVDPSACRLWSTQYFGSADWRLISGRRKFVDADWQWIQCSVLLRAGKNLGFL